MSTISERLGISKDLIELKFGKSFTRNSNSTSKYLDRNLKETNTELYHTIRYDFKPVSVDTSQTATIELNEKNKVIVTAPNLEGSGMPCTVFQGSRKPYLKECVLVIDHETGDFTLEKLTNNLVVKKTRAEGSSRSNQNSQQRPITPNISIQKSISPKLQNQNTFNKSPSNTMNFITNHRSPIEQKLPKEKLAIQQQSFLNSMPIFNSATFSNNLPINSTNSSFLKTNYISNIENLSCSSSSSSSSDDNDSSSSGSSSSSEEEDDEKEERGKERGRREKEPKYEHEKLQEQIKQQGEHEGRRKEEEISLIENDEKEEDEEENNSIDSSFNNYISNNTILKKTNVMSSFSSSEADSDDEDEKLKNLNNNLMNSLNNDLNNCGNNVSNNNSSIGFSSMPKFSDLNKDLQLSESGSDSE